jgi:hypothetical protein
MRFTLFFLSFAAVVVLSGSVAADPVVTFTGLSALNITGVTKNATVAVCGIGDVFVNGIERHVTQTKILTTDAVGAAQLAIDHPAFQSIWVVVDMTTGTYAVASPPGYVRKQMRVTPGTAADLGGVDLNWPLLEVFFIRPSAGIWYGIVADGRAQDADKQANGKVRVDLRSMRPLESATGTLSHVQAGDVILCDDPNMLESFVIHVGKGAPGAR